MDLKKIRKELLGHIDKNSSIQMEKVERYLNLIKIFYELDKSIEDLGAVITTINGAQQFSKTNPAIAEKNKINTSLIALGKDLGLGAEKPSKTKPVVGYDSSDLI